MLFVVFFISFYPFFAHVISQNYWNCLQYCCLPDGLVLIFELHNFGLAFVASGLSGLDLWIFFLQFCNHNWRWARILESFFTLQFTITGLKPFSFKKNWLISAMDGTFAKLDSFAALFSWRWTLNWFLLDGFNGFLFVIDSLGKAFPGDKSVV